MAGEGREPNGVRTCPYCAEEIQAAAVKCKHCGEWLGPGGRPGPPPAPVFPPPPVPAAPLAGAGGPIWPYALGAVSMVLAGLGLATFVGWMIWAGLGVILRGLDDLMGGSLGNYNLVWMARYFLGALAAGLLMAAGFCVYRHRRVGVALHVIYAIAAIVIIAGVAIALIFVRPGGTDVGFLVWPLWTATTAMVYPVFLLVWFSRARIKQQVRHWR